MRRYLFNALLLTWVFIAPTQDAMAQQIDGNELYSACQSENGVMQGFCIGYIIGAIENQPFGAYIALTPAQMWETTDEANRVISVFLKHCTPENASNEQLRDIVLKHLRTFPEQRHNTARGLVWDALVASFPCE